MSKYNLICPSGALFAPSLRLLFSVLSAALDGPPQGQLRDISTCAASIQDALDWGALTSQTFRLEMFHQPFLARLSVYIQVSMVVARVVTVTMVMFSC